MIVNRLGLDRTDAALCLAVLLGFLFVGLLPIAPKSFGDIQFHEDAKALAACIRGQGDFAAVKFQHAPGPVIYYTVPYILLPSNASEDTRWIAAFSWSVANMLCAILLIRRTAALLGGRLAGIWAAVISLLTPFAFYYSLGVSSEPPVYLSCCVFLYGWARLRHRSDGARGRNTAIMAAGLLAFLLCRPNALLLVPLGLLLGFLACVKAKPDQRNILRRPLQATIWAGVVFAVVILILNARGGGQSGLLAYNAMIGRFQFRTETWDWRFWDNETRGDSKDYQAWVATSATLSAEGKETGKPRTQLLREWVLADVAANPLLDAKLFLVRVLRLNVPLASSRPPEQFGYGRIRGAWVYWGFHAAVMAISLSILALAVVSIVKSRREWPVLWPLWGPYVTLLVFHAAVYAEPRYLFPAQPALAVMAGIVLAAWWTARSLREETT